MKRIVILCDGTWNSADMEHPTNVVQLGRAMAGSASEPADPPFMGEGVAPPRPWGSPNAPYGWVETKQIAVYVEGVGTGRRGVTTFGRMTDRMFGGALGWGLMDNVAEAYRHLVFVHEPGDEVYIFGFSRGAFTARSLVGLIRHAGLLSRNELHLLPTAVERYSDTLGVNFETKQARNLWWRMDHSPHLLVDTEDIRRLDAIAATPGHRFAAEAAERANELRHAPPFKIAFLGVWDTVGALGVPGWITAAPLINRKYQFHDAKLSDMVLSARHAVSLDEKRRSFEPTLWTNLAYRNGGRIGTPYQERWFAGDHGSVGGGGSIRDLSSIALRWLMEGAEAAGLVFDGELADRIRGEHNPMGPLFNEPKPKGGMVGAAMRRMGRYRKGPRSLDEVHDAARERWGFETKDDADWVPYRPGSLREVERHLEEWWKARRG